MEYEIEAKCRVTLDHVEGAETSQHIKTEYQFAVSKNVAKENFFDKNGVANKEGVKATTQCFVQGLVANIHAGHQQKLWDSAEHLRYIIKELERGFIQIGTATFEKVT